MGKQPNMNMSSFVWLFFFVAFTHGRVHKLTLQDDGRKLITMSTFGFLEGGTLAVNITSFSAKLSDKADLLQTDTTLFGFTFARSVTSTQISDVEAEHDTCILNNKQRYLVESVFFSFDFRRKRVTVERTGRDMMKLAVSSRPHVEFLNSHNLQRRDVDGEVVSTAGLLNTDKTNSTGNKAVDAETLSTNQDAVAAVEDSHIHSVDLTMNSDGVYQTYFLVYIQTPEEEGLYNLYFHNCLSYAGEDKAAVSLSMTITEDNDGNFLTAGEVPLPWLYLACFLLFFMTGITWLSMLCTTKDEDKLQIHRLMLVAVFVQSLNCITNSASMMSIQQVGFYIEPFASVRNFFIMASGLVQYLTVLMIGSGWETVKRSFTRKEKILFLIAIPLKVTQQVMVWMMETGQESDVLHSTLKEASLTVDLLCCGAVLFTAVWCMKHLQKVIATDEKPEPHQQKLRRFRFFYGLIVCFIYITRIIVYLLKMTLPFKLLWLTDLSTELSRWVFFTLTGVLFRPVIRTVLTCHVQDPPDRQQEGRDVKLMLEQDELYPNCGSDQSEVRQLLLPEDAEQKQ